MESRWKCLKQLRDGVKHKWTLHFVQNICVLDLHSSFLQRVALMFLSKSAKWLIQSYRREFSGFLSFLLLLDGGLRVGLTFFADPFRRLVLNGTLLRSNWIGSAGIDNSPSLDFPESLFSKLIVSDNLSAADLSEISFLLVLACFLCPNQKRFLKKKLHEN